MLVTDLTGAGSTSGFGCAGPGDPACESRVTRKPSGGARVIRMEFSEDPGWTGLTGALHRSDRCRLVELEVFSATYSSASGCCFAPRVSSRSVAT